MEAILRHVKKKKIPIKPVIVISNKLDAKGLKIAQKLGVKTEVVKSKGIKGINWVYDKKIISVLSKNGVTKTNGLICLAGFMRIMSPQFIRHYKNRVLNIHPALLPAFPGLHSQRQAVEYGVKHSGCTVHFVDEGVDTGPIIIQETVKLKHSDTENSLAKRILAKEHKIYPKAVELFAKGKIRISNRKTIIKN